MTNYHMPNAINISKAIMEAMLKVRKTHCAYSKTLHEEDRSLFNCQVSTNIYHCIKDNRNRSIEICIQPVWVKPSKYQLYITGYIISYFTLINILLRHDTFRRIWFCFWHTKHVLQNRNALFAILRTLYFLVTLQTLFSLSFSVKTILPIFNEPKNLILNILVNYFS